MMTGSVITGNAEVIGSEGILVFTRPFFQLHEDRQLLFIGLDDEPVEVPVPEMELYLGEIAMQKGDLTKALAFVLPTNLGVALTVTITAK